MVHRPPYADGAYLTWHEAAELTWCDRPPRGCDAALRPHDRAASGPHDAQVAHKARTRGKRPRMSTGPRGRPCGAPHGRRGSEGEGPTG